MSEFILRPSATLGTYPERTEGNIGVLQQIVDATTGLFRPSEDMASRRFQQFKQELEKASRALPPIYSAEFDNHLIELRQDLLRHGFEEKLAARAFALVRQTAEHTLGLRHHDEQLFAGWVMLHGRLAEMDTGEGKTLAATLPACTAALAGVPVHVITANDYLANRDAEQLRPLYHALNLSVCAVSEQNNAEADRRQAYGCNITYCTGKQVAFDYLRDRLAFGPNERLNSSLNGLRASQGNNPSPLLRGLCFAIVDEADSVLIDEAITPLILSREIPDSLPAEVYPEALALAKAMTPGEHYLSDERRRYASLNDAGKAWLEQQLAGRDGIWKRPSQRHELVRQALNASLFFERDLHYLVRDGRVEIIDPNTGRTMPDRSWELGLHQMIEAKEGCDISPRKETLARISFQRFFRRYLHLCGMTGTAREVSAEMRSVYRLPVVRVPTHKPSQRRMLPIRVFADKAAKWQAIGEQARELQRRGRPVLIGTRSVGDSEQLSRELGSLGLPHRVLNARQDRQEADIIAAAGEAGCITVATNMAGRGTDIKLSDEALRAGGLHVICAEPNDARRIDRQLFGRCGRHGDPGSYQVMLSIHDEVLNMRTGGPIQRVMKLNPLNVPGNSTWTASLVGLAQRMRERRNARARHQLLKLDRHLEDALAFSGVQE